MLSAPDPNEAANDLNALIKQIESHAGTKAHREWDSLTLVHKILIGNHRAFIGLIDAIESDFEMGIALVRNVGPREPGEEIMSEVVRLLHNYLASVVTLVDHTRKLMRQYDGTETAADYARRVAALRQEGVASFMTKFRNYVLHYKVPPIGTTMSFQTATSDMRVSMELDRDQALLYDDWPANARDYLLAQPPKIRLRDPVMQYATLIEDLYGWLYGQFTVLHADDVHALNELISRTPGYRQADGSPGEPESSTHRY